MILNNYVITDLTDTRCVGSFCINQFTGDLLIAEMLDTETQAVYTVPMAISNNITLEFDVSYSDETHVLKGS